MRRPFLVDWGDMKSLVLIALIAILAGCAATQEITQFDEAPPKLICIAKHDAVREGIIEALKEGFRQHGARTTVVRAIYKEEHNIWNPRIYPNEVQGCDAIVFYVANWTWDISMYMYFANIWVTDTAMTQKIAQATYQTGGGPDKWINAREKILEMVAEMYESVDQQATVTPQAAAIRQEIPKAASPAFDGDDPVVAMQRAEPNGLETTVSVPEVVPEKEAQPTERVEPSSSYSESAIDEPAPKVDLYKELLKLDDLRQRGILTDAEFQAEKKKLLDRD